MAHPNHSGLHIGDPAPDRGRVGRWLLTFALAAAPLAWSLQIGAGAAFGAFACPAGDGPVRPDGIDWAATAMIAVNLGALVLAVAGLIAAWVCLGRTGHSETDSFRGVLDAGEGRSRFLAVWGLFTGVLFVFAIAFNTVSVFWRGLC